MILKNITILVTGLLIIGCSQSFDIDGNENIEKIISLNTETSLLIQQKDYENATGSIFKTLKIHPKNSIAIKNLRLVKKTVFEESFNRILLNLCKKNSTLACKRTIATYLEQKKYKLAENIIFEKCKEYGDPICSILSKDIKDKSFLSSILLKLKQSCDSKNKLHCILEKELSTPINLFYLKTECVTKHYDACAAVGFAEIKRNKFGNAKNYLTRACENLPITSKVHSKACKALAETHRKELKTFIPHSIFKQLKKSCIDKDPLACYSIAFDITTSPRTNKRYGILHTACNNGLISACRQLALGLMQIPKYHEETLSIYKKLCDISDSISCIHAGSMLAFDLNANEAREYYKHSCKSGGPGCNFWIEHEQYFNKEQIDLTDINKLCKLDYISACTTASEYLTKNNQLEQATPYLSKICKLRPSRCLNYGINLFKTSKTKEAMKVLRPLCNSKNELACKYIKLVTQSILPKTIDKYKKECIEKNITSSCVEYLFHLENDKSKDNAFPIYKALCESSGNYCHEYAKILISENSFEAAEKILNEQCDKSEMRAASFCYQLGNLYEKKGDSFESYKFFKRTCDLGTESGCLKLYSLHNKVRWIWLISILLPIMISIYIVYLVYNLTQPIENTTFIDMVNVFKTTRKPLPETSKNDLKFFKTLAWISCIFTAAWFIVGIVLS